MKKFTYADSEAGKQTIEFSELSEIVKYIESFGYYGDSDGIVYCNDEPILQYSSKQEGLFWYKVD